MLRWPDAQTVERAVRRWAAEVTRSRGDVLRVGYFGSYARGDWGVGSDLDLIIIVKCAEAPFARRAAEWDTTDLPVPADVLVYSQEEWESLGRRGPRRFYHMAMEQVVWVWEEGPRPL